MTIGLLKEPAHETRVSLLPEAVATLTKKGITLIVEPAAGEKAFAADQDYEKAGAQIKPRTEILQSSDILLSLHPLPANEIGSLNSKVLIGVYQPLYGVDTMKDWATKGITT